MSDMLRLEQVTKQFGARLAVDSVDISVPQGETTVLIGPSGCGKSTLLRLMIGLVRPDSGTIFIDNQPLSGADLAITRRRMGYVIQDGGLFPHLSARANIVLMAEYLGLSDTAQEDRLKELVALTRFPADLLEQYPAQLSGGQRQRVALMRALMLDPDILLMDEPLGALDPIVRNRLQDELRDIFRSLDKTVVLVTHDMSEAAFFADKIVLLREGSVIQEGPIESLLRAPAEPFVEDFISAQRSHLPEAAK